MSSNQVYSDTPKLAPCQTPVNGELEKIVKRLSDLKDRFNSLANDFGINLAEPRDFAHADYARGRVGAEGISSLRVLITEINVQISEIETEHERLWTARTELLGGVATETGSWSGGRGPSPRDPRWDNQRDVPREDASGGCCRR